MGRQQKIYFASDFHLGAPYISNRRQHEERIVSWLRSIEDDATDLYLLGDVFDYWFEYKSVVPRGYVRFLGQLAHMVDHGLELHIFTGNHDVWMFDYMHTELGATIHTSDYLFRAFDRQFLVGHGDNLGYDKLYSALMWCFHNKTLQWCYKWLHPDLADKIATTWSAHSRQSHARHPRPLSVDTEYQVRFAKERIAAAPSVDYIIFGHRHEVLDYPIQRADATTPSRLLIIGDWIKNFTYAVFDGSDIRIEKYNPCSV